VGRLLRWPAQEEPFEVVGVVEDLKYTTLGEPPTPYFYRPASQEPLGAATLHVRTQTAPEALLGTVRREIRALDPNLPVVDARTVEAVLDEALWAPRLAAQLLGTFGLVALLLAATGLYAVLAYSVQQRRREIGVRVALGAHSGQVLGLVVRDGMLQVGAGVLLGALAALAGSRLLGALLYDLSGLELSVLLSAAAVLAGVALLACLLPAFKATGVDPAAVLRQE
jgi:ABC-type antimicrobial peptide transport system permease subunit